MCKNIQHNSSVPLTLNLKRPPKNSKYASVVFVSLIKVKTVGD